MKKIVALYREPADPEAFWRHYREVHVPLAKTVPGLTAISVTTVDRTLVGEPGNYLLAELCFADEDTFRSALRSPENAALGADLAHFAGGIVTVFTATSKDF